MSRGNQARPLRCLAADAGRCRPAGLLEKLIAAVRPEFRSRRAGIRPARPGVRRSCLRRRRLRPARAQRRHVPVITGGGGSQGNRTWRSSPPTTPAGLAAPPPASRHARSTGCLLRADSQRHVRAPPPAVAARWLPGAGVLARIRARRHALTQAGCLPDRPLRPVGRAPSSLFCRSHHVRWNEHGRPDVGRVRYLLPGRRARWRRAHRPAATAGDAAAGGAVRAPVPPG